MYKQEDFCLPFSDSDHSPDYVFPNLSEILPSLSGDLLQLSPQHAEETMDVAKLEQQEFLPVSPLGPPDRNVFAGEYDFQVEINASDTHKRKYLYSSQLNRIYVDMKVNFPVQFRWQHALGPRAFFVRACVVFSDQSQAEKRVERCTQHTHDTSNAVMNLAIVKNVLHSSREKGTHGVHYCGIPDMPDSWYSVLVELPSLPAGPCTHAFQFVCKNSCPNGINRRAIDIIFTLEDATGKVYGRQTVGARACSCPRRDMVRDEEVEGGSRLGKRKLTATEARTKRLKVEVVANDDTVFTLPPLEVVGVRPVITGLGVMLSMMEQALALKRNDPQAVEKYTKCITSLKSQIEELGNIKPQTQ